MKMLTLEFDIPFVFLITQNLLYENYLWHLTSKMFKI